jgi:hypothetical protein
MPLTRRIEKRCWIPLAPNSVALVQHFVKRVARLINCDRSWYDTSPMFFWRGRRCFTVALVGYQADREVLLGDSRRTASQLQSSLVRHRPLPLDVPLHLL